MSTIHFLPNLMGYLVLRSLRKSGTFLILQRWVFNAYEYHEIAHVFLL